MMEILTGISGNYIIKVTFASWCVAQILKTIINAILTKDLKLERLVGAGGMPSSHSALVVALAISTAKQCGVESVEFALAAAFAGVVMYDAMGVRRAAGEQAKIINRMVDEWLDKTYWKDKRLPQVKQLKEMLGHTPLEVIGGIIVGIVVSSMF